MNNITKIINKYTSGEATLEETNKALKAEGAIFYLDPNRNIIADDERERFGLLDTGTGTLDKVEIEDMKLKNVDCGDMYALCTFNGKTYKVKGVNLVEQ